MSDLPIVQLDPQFISPPAADDLRLLRETLGTSTPEAAAALERVVAFNETMRVALGGQIGPALYAMHSDLRSQFLSLQRQVENLCDYAREVLLSPRWINEPRKKPKPKPKKRRNKTKRGSK
jgi:hypothetical protein